MNEGYWIRLDTGKAFSVQDHEIDVRRPEVAKVLGVPNEVFQRFGMFKPIADRDRFLRWLMKRVPIVRARGTSVFVTLEWGCGRDRQAFKAIHKWGQKVCGPDLMLCMSNLTTGKVYNSYWLLFDKTMKSKKPLGHAPVIRTEPLRKSV